MEPSSLPSSSLGTKTTLRETRGHNLLFSNISSLNHHRRCGSVVSFDHFPTKYPFKTSWIMDHHPLHPQDDPNHRVSAAVGYYGPASQTRDWNDRWETNTAITANTSLHSGSIDLDLNLAGKTSSASNSTSGLSKRRLCLDEDFTLRYRMDSGFIVSSIVSVCAFLSPIIMIILPRLNSLQWNVSQAGPECDGILISFCCKLLLLVLASWLLFLRKPRASFPGIVIYRAVVVGFIFLLLLSYWLFYSIRASERRLADYDLPFKDLLLSYPVPLVENLLWVHYLAVILMEIRHSRPEYHIKIVRSPDGVARSYTIGSLSIQRTAVWVLEKYYTEFPIYNPHLDTIPSVNKKKGKSSENRINVLSDSMTTTQGTPGNRNTDHSLDLNGGVKYYDIDGMNMMNQRNQHGYHNVNSSTPNTSSNTPFFQQNHHTNGVLAGNVGIVMPSTPRSIRGLLNQSGNNNEMSEGSNSIYSMPRNSHHHQSNHSKKSHSVVGVETSSRRGSGSRSSSSQHHHHRSGRSGSRDRGRDKDRDHHHHHREHDRDHDRLYQEFEFDRKVKKRRARLISSAEEAFTHIKLVGDTDTQGKVSLPCHSWHSKLGISIFLSCPPTSLCNVRRDNNIKGIAVVFFEITLFPPLLLKTRKRKWRKDCKFHVYFNMKSIFQSALLFCLMSFSSSCPSSISCREDFLL